MTFTLSDNVKYLKGVGPQRAELLADRGIVTIEDLLLHFPFRYEDRIHFSRIRDIKPGGTYTVLAEVVSSGTVRFARSRGQVFHMAVRDAGKPGEPRTRPPMGMLHCKFFHSGYLEGRLKEGQRLVLHGKAEVDAYHPTRVEMINPEFELLSAEDEAADSTEVGRIVPVYEAVGKMSSRVLRRVIYGLLGSLEGLTDPLPAAILGRYRYPSRRDAVLAAHFPPASLSVEALNQFRSPAHQRLIFEEFFYYQLGLALRRRESQREPGIAFTVRHDRIREAVRRILPFKPTSAQKRVLAEIAADMEKPVPMHRLLQGDVGSGKTIVALEAATIAIENGYQVALMAPTEILAAQHFLSSRRIFSGTEYTVDLLISALAAAERRATRERIRSGKSHLVVGTHALIEEEVAFGRLGLVIVDEQHRFGVMQRKRLMEKAAGAAAIPDVLVMTATPIPRTLALTLYGDLDVSIIDELPPGRTPIETRLTTEEKLPAVWDFVQREVARGRQAYVVYPVIEESKQELKAAMVEYQRLSKEVWPALRVGLLHGRLRSDEKESVMQRFRSGELQVLVATTVIEVGVDVPNATVMVIEHAERFGLSQLHQLRGRIGRGSVKSYCVLVGPPQPSEESQRRLETMVSTSDGFKLAEVDLELRGPGEFFGTRQHGDTGFHIAQPLRDKELLQAARHEAFALVEAAEKRADAGAELRRLADYLGSRWQRRYQLARVG